MLMMGLSRTSDEPTKTRFVPPIHSKDEGYEVFPVDVAMK